MGVVGLQYETLFLYDPIKDTYTPWLATNNVGTAGIAPRRRTRSPSARA
jgi:hypothetical protein